MADAVSVEMDPSVGFHHHQDDDDDDDEQNPSDAAPNLDDPNIFLSVVNEGPFIAFCAYNEGNDTLYIETGRANGFEVESIVSSVLTRIRPTMLLLPTRVVSNAKLLQVLTTPVETTVTRREADENNQDSNTQSQQDNNRLPSTTPYKIVKSSWLDIKNCRQMVLKLRVQSLMVRASNSNDRLPAGRHNNISNPRSIPTTAAATTTPSFGVSHYNALASLIDFDSKVLIQAIGSLLFFLQGSVLLYNQPHDNSFAYHHDRTAAPAQECLDVSHLQRLQLDQYVFVPASTMEALHIFRTDHHPLALANGATSHNKSKEGYSLFSWLDRTHFSDARLRLKEWMHQPLRDLRKINIRQTGVELFASEGFTSLAETLAGQARHLRPSVSSILTRFSKNTSSPVDFCRLVQTLERALEMCDILEKQVLWKIQQWGQQVQWQREQHRQARQQQQQQQQQQALDNDDDDDDDTQQMQTDEVGDMDGDGPPIQEYIEFIESILTGCHVPSLQQVIRRITETIDVNLTQETLHLTVLSGVSEDLDRHRQEYAELKTIMSRHATCVERRFPNLPPLKVVFFPQLGYFVTLDVIMEGEDDSQAQNSHDASYFGSGTQDICSDLVHDDDMRLQWVFRDGHRDYYKTHETAVLDSDIGDVDITIKNDEFMIASALEDDILVCDRELQETYSVLADLDCILSFAEIARQHGLVRPIMKPAEENCILVISGGHPLQEHSSPGRFVRNHTTIDDVCRVNIISGPNYSGKSCYARQVGILTYMAHLGCFLPCSGAQISVVDRILTQFSGVETCMVPQSSFQLDLTNMGGILRTATRQSLVLIDEFGKGTSPASGIALLAAGLHNLSEIGCKVVCTTHFLEIFSVGLLRDGVDGIRALQMAVNFPDANEELAVPTFVLVSGLSDTSAGLSCARLSGVKASVIARAQEIVVAMRKGRNIRPLDEILLRSLNLSPTDKVTIHKFITSDLQNASATDVAKLRDAILRMQSNET